MSPCAFSWSPTIIRTQCRGRGGGSAAQQCGMTGRRVRIGVVVVAVGEIRTMIEKRRKTTFADCSR